MRCSAAVGTGSGPLSPDEFVSLLAHELKTPLTPLKAVAQLMRSRIKKAREGSKPLDMDALDRSAATLERQVDRMDHLITDLLEASRIARGTFELRPAPFDLAASVKDLVRRWREGTSDEGRHRFELESPQSLTITGDQQRLEQVIRGLIGNAVKFSPSRGTIHIAIEPRDGEACVTVRDEGIGIPADEIATLAREPFVRGKRAHGYAGMGVGLYLCREVAERHGGRLELESEGEDRGTTARISLAV